MGKTINVAKKNDLPQGKGMAVDAEGKRIAVFNVDGNYFAIDGECTHAGGPLSEGELNGTTVTCPWHGATFNVQTGEALTAPAYDKVNAYKVSLKGEDIVLELP